MGGLQPRKAPDNWTSFKAVDDHHFTLTFDKVYNSDWMLANELSAINPLPQHAWDKTAASAAVFDTDRTAAGAKQVWTYLDTAAKNISGYEKDALWKTTSGPYAVKSFWTAGKVVLTADRSTTVVRSRGHRHREPPPVHDGGRREERTALGERRLRLHRGDRPRPEGPVHRPGVHGQALVGLGDHLHAVQLQQPLPVGTFKQLYARQAVQRSIDQSSLAKVILGPRPHDTGYGPIPQAQSSDFLSPTQKGNPYPSRPRPPIRC